MKVSAFAKTAVVLLLTAECLFSSCSSPADSVSSAADSGSSAADSGGDGSSGIDAPESLMIEPLECDNGLKLNIIDKTTGKILDKDENIREKKYLVGDIKSLNYKVCFYIDNIIVMHGMTSFEGFEYPFVEANKEINLRVDYVVERYNGEGKRVDTKLISRGQLKYTPTTGLGKVSCTGELKFDYSEDGTVKITEWPQFSPASLDYGICFDFATGDDRTNETWIGELCIPHGTDSGNIYESCNMNTLYGIEHGFIAPYLYYYYTGSNGKREKGRFESDAFEVKKDIKLSTGPENLMIVPLECDNGLKLNIIDKTTGEILDIDKDIREEKYSAKYLVGDIKKLNYGVYFSIDNITVMRNKRSFEGIEYPFVEPNKEINLKVDYVVERYNGEGKRVDLKSISRGQLKYTPTTGLGKLSCTGKLKFDYSEDGTVKITEWPQFSPASLDYGICIEFATGDDWENGRWIGAFDIPHGTDSGNIYESSTYMSTLEIEHGFISQYLYYYYTGSNGKQERGRFESDAFELKKDIKLSPAPGNLTIEPLECDNGLKLNIIDKTTGKILDKDEDIREEKYSAKYLVGDIKSLNYRVCFYIDNITVMYCMNFFEGVEYPYVEPNKEINLKVDYVVERYNGEGKIVDTKLISHGQLKYTPTTGLGKVSCTGKLKFDYSEHGTVKITEWPKISPASLDCGICFDFVTGDDWSNGTWIGVFDIPHGTDSGNVHETSGYTLEIEHGFICPYLYYYTGSNGKQEKCRFDSDAFEVKKDIKLSPAPEDKIEISDNSGIWLKNVLKDENVVSWNLSENVVTLTLNRDLNPGTKTVRFYHSLNNPTAGRYAINYELTVPEGAYYTGQYQTKKCDSYNMQYFWQNVVTNPISEGRDLICCKNFVTDPIPEGCDWIQFVFELTKKGTYTIKNVSITPVTE